MVTSDCGKIPCLHDQLKLSPTAAVSKSRDNHTFCFPNTASRLAVCSFSSLFSSHRLQWTTMQEDRAVYVGAGKNSQMISLPQYSGSPDGGPPSVSGPSKARGVWGSLYHSYFQSNGWAFEKLNLNPTAGQGPFVVRSLYLFHSHLTRTTTDILNLCVPPWKTIMPIATDRCICETSAFMKLWCSLPLGLSPGNVTLK